MRKQIEYLVFAVILAILAARAQTAPPESGPMIIDQIKNTVVFLESSWTERDVKVEGGRIEAVQASKSQVGTGPAAAVRPGPLW